jgi:hypothetical protein
MKKKRKPFHNLEILKLIRSEGFTSSVTSNYVVVVDEPSSLPSSSSSSSSSSFSPSYSLSLSFSFSLHLHSSLTFPPNTIPLHFCLKNNFE